MISANRHAGSGFHHWSTLNGLSLRRTAHGKHSYCRRFVQLSSYASMIIAASVIARLLTRTAKGFVFPSLHFKSEFFAEIFLP